MDEFGFEELRDLHRREKKDTGPAEVGENFYKKLALLIKKLKQNYESNPDVGKLREIENITKLADDLFILREQKIVLKALRSVRTGKKKKENLTPEEEKVFNLIVDVLERNRKFFEAVMNGEYPEESLTSRQVESTEIPKTILNKEEHKIVLIRVLKDVPRFVGTNSKEYGPFKKNEMVKLPEAEANILLKRNLAEVV